MGNKQRNFEALIVPHAASLLRFARRLCGNSALAEDLVQEALLKAWRNSDAVGEIANPRPWIFRILLNTWYSEGRRRSARPMEAPLADARHVSEVPAANASHALETLALLPEEQRTALLLAAVEGFTCREIADMLDVPQGTVMSRLSRGRAAMRELVAGEPKKTGVGCK